MLERPRFIFEQEEQRQEQSNHVAARNARLVTEVDPSFKKSADKQGNFETLDSSTAKNSAKRQQNPASNKVNPEKGLTSFKSQSHIVDSSTKTNGREALRYAQPETHMKVITTSAAKSTVGERKNAAGLQKEIIHLEEAKGMKPNTFFREDNQSPIPQDDQRFTLAPPVYAPTEFDPYKYVGMGKKRNNTSKNYQIMLESDTKKQKKTTKTVAETTNSSSVHNSSQVVLNQHEKQPQISVTVIKQEKEEVAYQHPGSIVPFTFNIQKIFGTNFFNPQFKILSAEGELLISAQKESFHVNSHYNIYSGNIRNNKRVGFIVGNFMGSQFDIYSLANDAEELVATVCYKTEISCNSYRKMEVFVKKSGSSKFLSEEARKGKSLNELYFEGMKEDIARVVTKEPTWREDLQVYVMNFKGKSKMSSAKNMVLRKEDQTDSSLLFCKQGVKSYYLQFNNTFNLLISMGILLSSFDFKLACQ